MPSWLQALNQAPIISCDIETNWPRENTLACIGFAVSPHQAYVIPASDMDSVRTLCAHPVPKIWANGKFDLAFLKQECGIEVQGEVHDVMAQWFALYPEIAGAKEDRKKRGMTRKSLSFLASIFTYDEYWKGVYENEYEFFQYNGKDCCITFDIWEHQNKLLKQMGVQGVYEHICGLIWPCVDMLLRGMEVDEELRKERLAALVEKGESIRGEVKLLVEPLLEKWRGDKRLFEQQEGVCECCRHASKKQAKCWGCAGFEKAPSKGELLEKFGAELKGTKAELEKSLLEECKVCGGKERREWIEWNPGSHEQNKIVLYKVLRLPPRTRQGSGA